jgi:hypothetical protein
LTRATEQADSFSLDDYADVNDTDDNNDDITTITAQVKTVLILSATTDDIKGQPSSGTSTSQVTELRPLFKAAVILQN